MKLFFLFACVVVSVTAWGKGDLEKYGPFQVALHSKLIKCNHNRDLNLDVSGILVYFYDFAKNDTRSFPISDASQGILALPNFDKNRKFFVLVAGYKSQISKRTEQQFRDTFKDFPNSYLLIFDHSPYTHDRDGYVKSYERSVMHVHYIGKAVAHFLTGLNKGGVSAKNMHCIGHSLGSQILGQAGEMFSKNTNQKLWRITALDPAGPCFSNSLTQEQVRSGVAEYVEVYHCNAGGLGTTSVLGDIDFFMNKRGQSQPHCGTPLVPGVFDSAKAARCSHRTCIDVWTASVSRPGWYLAFKCDDYKKFKHGECSSNERTLAGFWNPGNATGVFYFSTNGLDLSD